MSMEETAVLLSIQPEWCSRIFSGYKTVEIRKTRPVSLKEPFKCYIYCTKGTKFFCWKAVDHLYFDDGSHNLFDRRADGMVVGEFICDDIRRIGPEYCAVKEDIESAISGSLLTVPQVKDYAGWKSGMSYADLKDLYAWHISKEIPFFEWFAHPLKVVGEELFILPKEDPRMDMGRNSEHYSDPTPGTAWENMRREEKRLDAARLVVVSALVPILRQTAELAGFEIIGRIPLRDKATGKEYR